MSGILDVFEPIYRMLPEVKPPEGKPPLKTRLMWTGVILLLFYIMGNIAVIGLDPAAESTQNIAVWQVILASKLGTILTVGIGPIVLASIILQLMVGSGILNIDLSNPADKSRFSSLQKLFAIVLCFFESIVYAVSGLLVPLEGMFISVVLQVSLGAIALLYMDEVVSKYGIGSGISLFIAAGVSEAVIWQLFNPLNASAMLDPLNGQGHLFLFIQNAGANLLAAINAYLLPITFSVIVFLVVVYAEGMHVNIPITMGRRGTGGRYPVKLLYVSNIPVILAVALFANIQIWAGLLKDIPIIGAFIGGIGAIVQAPYGLRENLFTQLMAGEGGLILNEVFNSLTSLQFIGLGGELIHAVLYIIVLVAVCVVFGKFWIEMAGQGPDSVANQLQKSGMYIPGFRRDPRVVRKVLGRYIPPITILGSAFVGLLAGFADLTGALGSGTGILLTVGIVYRLYEELAKQQLFDMHPMLGRLFG